MDERLAGSVYSHTVIRVPGRAHANEPPFAIIAVELADGRHVLGRVETSDQTQPPAIGARVVEVGRRGSVLVFAADKVASPLGKSEALD